MIAEHRVPNGVLGCVRACVRVCVRACVRLCDAGPTRDEDDYDYVVATEVGSTYQPNKSGDWLVSKVAAETTIMVRHLSHFLVVV